MLISTERVKNIIQNNHISIVDIVVILGCECNAGCAFCVGKHVIKNSTCKLQCGNYSAGCVRCCDRTATDTDFYERLEDLLSVACGQNVRITLTGGEPTILTRLIPTLQILDKYHFQSVNIETNGANLLNEDLSEALISRKVNILLSKYALDDEKNGAIFKFRDRAVNNAEIREILQRYGELVTMNCVLTKEGISCGAEIIEYYDYYKSLGAKNITFTEMMFDTTLSNQNENIAQYYSENYIGIGQLSEELVARAYEKTVYIGEDFRVILHSYKDDTITMTAADMSRIASKQQNDNTYSKYLVYPSGEMGVHSIEDR